MANNKRVPIVKNFWKKTEEQPDTTLYEDQLGWTIPLKVESGGYTETYDVWEHLMEDTNIRGVGWDLCFFYPPTGHFYYIDQIDKVLYKLPILPHWNGHDLIGSVDITPQLVPEEDELMDFEKVSEIWDNFKIDGKDMRYIIDHSVLFLST